MPKRSFASTQEISSNWPSESTVDLFTFSNNDSSLLWTLIISLSLLNEVDDVSKSSSVVEPAYVLLFSNRAHCGVSVSSNEQTRSSSWVGAGVVWHVSEGIQLFINEWYFCQIIEPFLKHYTSNKVGRGRSCVVSRWFRSFLEVIVIAWRRFYFVTNFANW